MSYTLYVRLSVVVRAPLVLYPVAIITTVSSVASLLCLPSVGMRVVSRKGCIDGWTKMCD